MKFTADRAIEARDGLTRPQLPTSWRRCFIAGYEAGARATACNPDYPGTPEGAAGLRKQAREAWAEYEYLFVRRSGRA